LKQFQGLFFAWAVQLQGLFAVLIALSLGWQAPIGSLRSLALAFLVRATW
jgi:hypothetical protein